MTAEMGLPQTQTPAADNPSVAPDKSLPERTRIPMSLPTLKLAVPEIPGYHCHWMRGDAQRIHQALRAGYAFVEPDEVNLNDFGLANGPDDSGNQDLGSRVSHISGTAADGKAETLYLMKLPLALWEADQAALGQRQEQIASSIRGDKGFSEGGMDTSNRYAGAQSNKNQNIFIPKRSS
jgi:hypothetical protein